LIADFLLKYLFNWAKHFMSEKWHNSVMIGMDFITGFGSHLLSDSGFVLTLEVKADLGAVLRLRIFLYAESEGDYNRVFANDICNLCVLMADFLDHGEAELLDGITTITSTGATLDIRDKSFRISLIVMPELSAPCGM
ncbi:hypothetical protein ACJX0J_027112, partial [Zea mays]